MNSIGPEVRIICWGLMLTWGCWPRAAEAGEAPCEAELRQALDGFGRAVEAKDVEAALEHLSDTYTGSRYPYTKNDMRESLERLVRVSRNIVLSYEYKEFHCAGDLALVTATRRFVRGRGDQAEPVSTVEDYQIQFEKQDGRWRMMWDHKLLPDMPVPHGGQVYQMAQQGFAVTVPLGYSYRMGESGDQAPMLIGVTDDLRRSVSVKGSNLGVTIHPEQVGDLVANQVALNLPDCEVTGQERRKISGLQAVLIDLECLQFKGRMWSRTAVVLDGRDFFLASVDAADRGLRSEAQSDLERVLASLRRVPKVADPCDAGGVVQGCYRDPASGMEIKLPERWRIKVGKRGALVTATDPSGTGVIRVKVIDLLENEDAMALIERDDKTSSQIFAGYSCEKRLPLKVGSLVGAQSLSRFSLGDGVKVWRVCFTKSKRAYIIECEAQPSEEFEKLEPAFRRAVESFGLGKPVKRRD